MSDRDRGEPCFAALQPIPDRFKTEPGAEFSDHHLVYAKKGGLPCAHCMTIPRDGSATP